MEPSSKKKLEKKNDEQNDKFLEPKKIEKKQAKSARGQNYIVKGPNFNPDRVDFLVSQFLAKINPDRVSLRVQLSSKSYS